MTLKDHYPKDGYGPWSEKPDFNRCCVSVADGGRSVSSHQCKFKNGYGPDGAYCKTHSPKAQEERLQKPQSRFEAKLLEDNLRKVGRALVALQAIADGANDPRQVALEALSHYKKSFWWDPEKWAKHYAAKRGEK